MLRVCHVMPFSFYSTLPHFPYCHFSHQKWWWTTSNFSRIFLSMPSPSITTMRLQMSSWRSWPLWPEESSALIILAARISSFRIFRWELGALSKMVHAFLWVSEIRGSSRFGKMAAIYWTIKQPVHWDALVFLQMWPRDLRTLVTMCTSWSQVQARKSYRYIDLRVLIHFVFVYFLW